MVQTNPDKSSNADLIELARSLTANGPHKIEPTTRRVRGQFDAHWVFDTTSAYHVWEHPYYPQFYVPTTEIKGFRIVREEAVDHDERVYVASVRPEGQGNHGEGKVLRRVLVFEQGQLEGLVRLEFKELGWSSAYFSLYRFFTALQSHAMTYCRFFSLSLSLCL